VTSKEPLPTEVNLRYPIQVFSTKDSGKVVGTLTSGMIIHILNEPEDAMVRVRFSSRDGKTYEALLREKDIRKQMLR